MKPKSGAPELYIEKAALGEATEAERQQVEASEGSAGRMAALRESNAEILARYPVGPAVAELQRRVAASQRRPRRRAMMWLPVAVMAAGSVLALLFLPQLRPGGDSATSDGVRTKGLLPHLVAFRQPAAGARGQTQGQADELADGAIARAGESVQLGYVAAGQRYGVLISIDGRGGVTLHLPASESELSPALRQGGQALLEQSFRLDDAPRFERFFLVSSPDQPFSVAEVMRSARKLANNSTLAETALLGLPAGLRQSSLLLRKG